MGHAPELRAGSRAHGGHGADVRSTSGCFHFIDSYLTHDAGVVSSSERISGEVATRHISVRSEWPQTRKSHPVV